MNHAVFTSSYDYRLVSLSVLIAVCSSYAALDLAGRTFAARGNLRVLWLGGGAVAMGQGIWCMHYVGMLALRLPVAVRYDTVLVAASLLAAILASAIALLMVTGERFGVIQILTGSLVMGSGIGAMHYTGMSAMNMPAECHYRTGIVILSIAIAIAVSAVALAITFWFRREGERSFGLKLAAAVIMGTGICAMHYTGMMAVTYTAAIPPPDSMAFNVSPLDAASLSTVALMILTLAILTSLGDRRFSAQAVELEEQAALLHLAHDSIIVCDLNARIVFWSRGAEQNYGWSRSEALGRIAHQFLHTRFPENREQIMSELLRNSSWEGELIHTCSSGLTMTVASRWALQRDGYGLPKRIMEINNDISQRKRAEEHLRQSEERYRDLFEHAAELIQNVGPRGNLLFVNPAWKATLGYGDKDLPSLTMLNILAPEARDAWNVIAARALNGETIDQVESRFLTRDGRSVHVAGRVTCRRDEKGEVAYTSAILRDVTKAKEVAQLKDEFVSIVSHELRTPLTSIRGSLGLLASGMMQSLPEKGQRMLTIALNNTERLVRLINDILDLERIQSGKVPMHKSLSDAEALMCQSVEVVQATAEKANVVVALDAVSIPLMVDPDRIVQTFTNLLSNAIKFSPPGAMVHFSVRRKGTNAVFKVQDTGRGIPAGKLDLVFERFQQVDASDARVKGGTGLGLSICRKIVEQHDGTIWVESVFGSGSSFYIGLPAAASANMTTVNARPAKSRPPGSLGLLIVEDDLDLANVLLEMFESDGICARHATTTPQAVEMTRSDSPDLIVLDVCLAEGTAFDVVNSLRHDDRLREVAIMVYSARDLTPEEKQELDLGHTEFYTKSRIAPEVFARRAVDRIRKISSMRKAAVAH